MISISRHGPDERPAERGEKGEKHTKNSEDRNFGYHYHGTHSKENTFYQRTVTTEIVAIIIMPQRAR